jgi:hypothetical protein
MMQTLFPLFLTVSYATIGAVLWHRAMRFRTDERPPRAFDIFRPALFPPRGQASRRRAVRFYVIGGIAATIAYWLFRVSRLPT